MKVIANRPCQYGNKWQMLAASITKREFVNVLFSHWNDEYSVVKTLITQQDCYVWNVTNKKI